MSVLKKMFSKKIIIPLIIVAGISGGLVYYFKYRTTSTTQAQTFATVTRGEISTSISGSGTLISSDKSDISARVSGTITKLNFKEADKVKAGDVIFELDETDGLTKVRQLNDSINQTQITSNNNLTSIDKLNLRAPFSGQVSTILVKTGDVAGKNASILTITDLSKLKIQIPFNASALGSVKENQSITLHVADLMQSVKGTINYANNKGFPSNNGGQIFYVEAYVDNPGSLNQGMKASAEVETSNGKLLSTDYGTLNYLNNSIVKCDSGGTVTNVNVKDSQFVNTGDILVQFQNTDLELAKESNQSKLADLDKQLGDANKTLENYKVATPVEGVITKQTLHVGDVVKQGDIVSSVSNNIHMEFSVAFDELDIAKVEVGQKSTVTIDALPETLNRPLVGTVSKIAIEGATSSGVTTYPVTISVEGNEKLKLGMNASAQVIIQQKTNILRLPINSVQKRGNRASVMVVGTATTTGASIGVNGGQGNQGGKGTGFTGNRNRGQNTTDQSIGGQGGSGQSTSGQGGSGQNGQSGNRQGGNRQSGNAQSGGNTQAGGTAQAGAGTTGTGGTGVNSMWAGNTQVAQYYANAVQKVVEVGITNADYIEIVSGLNEGDQVILPPTIATAAASTTANARPAGGIGGMGGGFVGGGAAQQQGGGQNRTQGGRGN